MIPFIEMLIFLLHICVVLMICLLPVVVIAFRTERRRTPR